MSINDKGETSIFFLLLQIASISPLMLPEEYFMIIFLKTTDSLSCAKLKNVAVIWGMEIILICPLGLNQLKGLLSLLFLCKGR